MVEFRVKLNQIINVLLILGIGGLLSSSTLRTSVASTLQGWLLKTGMLDADATPTEALGTLDRQFALAHLDGTPFDHLTLDGKPIFLHIWASWCPPCIAELPGIQRLVQSVSPEEVAFLLVSVDKNPHQAQQFLQKNEYSLPVYRFTEELPDGIAYNVIPTTYIIAPSGKIIYKHEGLAQYNHEDFKDFLLKSD